MKFLVDAQLPLRLARWLATQGYDVLHTRDLPDQNATSDGFINQLSMQEERVVITKDVDFVNSFLTVGQPFKLLLVTTGNVRNSELEELFRQNLERCVELLEQNSYVELSRAAIVVHQ